MRRFRLKDQDFDYKTRKSQFHEYGSIYYLDYIDSDGDVWLKTNTDNCSHCYAPFEVEEVFDEKPMITAGPVTFTPIHNPLHKDTDLGYYAGLAMQGILANEELRMKILSDASQNKVSGFECIEKEAIRSARELIKQLNEERK